ncbi:MAG TPA: hypothetical protein QGF35_02865 [Dehalococcoidia bacterium]|nr:hypothetical protein [Dehalococcoidia bacterium]
MSPLIGHEAVLSELKSLARSERPPHALLMVGTSGLGRTALALEYAKLLNCEELGPEDSVAGRDASASACGTCRACRLFESRQHPDLLAVGPGDAMCKPRPSDANHDSHPTSRDIRICQIRGIIEAIARYPVEARCRVVILEPAERLGREAANTLLKTLEEPAGHAVIILVTSAPEALPETIISRCRRINVSQVPRDVIELALMERGFAPALAARAGERARGRPVLALTLAEKPDEMDVQERLLGRCARIAEEPSLAERLSYASELAERWRRGRDEVTAELSAWESFWESRLLATADEDADAALNAASALRCIAEVREDLQTQVLPRPVFDLMLLRFPRVTLSKPSSQEPQTTND